MSTITKTWTEDKIRSIIRKLDEKTGLNGTALPIAFNSYGWFLGHYRYVEPKAFGFNRKFFNDSTTGEADGESDDVKLDLDNLELVSSSDDIAC